MTHLALLVTLLTLLATSLTHAQNPTPQQGQQQATIILPANVISQAQQQQPSTTVPPAQGTNTQPTLIPQPATPPPPPPKIDLSKEQAELAKRCPPIDKYLADHYSPFFLLLRSTIQYTQDNPPQPTAGFNASYGPMTILVPAGKTFGFLQEHGLDITTLAQDPLQSVLLAPTLAQHFVRGYWPANALPLANQSTLCGSNCADVNFQQQGDRVIIYSGNANVTLSKTDVVNCPGRYVIHEVDNFLYTPVSNPLYAAEPALNLAYALGGELDQYRLAAQKGKRKLLG